MTEKANPSPNRPADAFKTAGAIAHGGGSVDGHIIDGSNPTNISVQDRDIDETALDSFSQSSSSSSLTVGINAGEAFVYGSWLAIDTQTTVSLNSSTTGQTVYVGWNKDTSNDVIIGLDSEFATTIADTDQRIPLYDFDTDGDGVTNVTDKRQVDQKKDLSLLSVADELGVPVYEDSTNAPQTEGSVIAIDGSGSQSAGLYLHDGTSYITAGKSDGQIDDIVTGLLAAGTDISLDYDDANNTLTINNTGGYSNKEAQDAIASAFTGADKVGVTYDEPNDTITVDTTALDAEEVEDQVNSLLSSGSNIGLNYDDANNALIISLSNSLSVDSVTLSELMEMSYDPNSDAIIFSDSTNTTDRLALDRTTGDLKIAGEITENESL